MKVTFDFDGTLSNPEVQEFAKNLVNIGLDVWIITARVDNEIAIENGWHWIVRQNKRVFEISEKCGIKSENIIFTSMYDKIEFIEGNEFIFHLDDDNYEIELINNNSDNCVGIYFLDTDWKQKCLNLIK